MTYVTLRIISNDVVAVISKIIVKKMILKTKGLKIKTNLWTKCLHC